MGLLGRGRLDFGTGTKLITPAGGTLTVSGILAVTGNQTLGGNLTLTAGGIINTTANGSITLLPNGSGITIVGDAGTTSHSLATNDDCLITGKLEVDGYSYFDGGVAYYGDCSFNGSIISSLRLNYVATGSSSGILSVRAISEIVTIPVGSGNTPVVASSANLAPANSIIKAVTCRVTQAPGGGATVVSVGRTGGNTDEFIDDISTALGTTGNSVANNDGALVAEDLWNTTATTFDVTTDADVTGTDMKIRITVWYEQITAPTS